MAGLFTGVSTQQYSPIARFGGTLLTSIGTHQQMKAYEAAGVASMASARYNAAIEELNSERRQVEMGRQVSNILSTQRAQAGASGLDVTSKSFLALMNESISSFESAIINERNVSEQRQDSLIYQGRVAEAAAKAKADAARAQMFGGIFQTILGGIF